MNYFFVSGLTTRVTSVENPTSINSWVKVLSILILYALCISSITVCNSTVVFAAICMPGVFSSTVCRGSQDNALKNMLLRC